jgi:hypothetical protein
MAVESRVTEYGKVYRLVGGCKDNWDNIITATIGGQYSIGSETYTLQKPAVDSLRWVASEIGQWGPFRFRKRVVLVTGTIRTCERQAALYASDPSRYAPPSVGLHTQGLAIDVDMNWYTALSDKLKGRFRTAMRAAGWTQSRPTDEPWHWSFGWTA